MPVTARLSQKFYERLGEDLAQELVDWFNAVDATYRADLRELNELNFQRFDAKVEQRLAELRAYLDRRLAESVKELDGRITVSVAGLDQRITDLERSVGRVETTFERRLGGATNSLVRWMFGFWALTLGALAGIVYYLR